MRRVIPLQVTRRHRLRVPTARDILRIKAFLCTERRAVRDFVDVAALARHLGDSAAGDSLKYLNLTYDPMGAQSRITRFAEVCEQEPLDLHALALADYKGLQAPFTDWPFVRTTCQNLARRLLKLELTGALPGVLDAGFYEPTAA